MATLQTDIEVAGRVVRLSNPDKVFFAARGETKLDLVRYYLAVGEAALLGVRERPTVLKRYPNGAGGDFFYQKRVPAPRPEWLETVTVHFPSGRSAEELCPTDVAHLLWAVNLGCLDFNPWAVRRADLEHPDELRVDLDPQPDVPFSAVRRVAVEVGRLLGELGLQGWPKTSGSRGLHVYVRIRPEWDFLAVRRAALALARAVERRLPELATSKWWKEERGTRVFIDYNQNARDRTVASVYSVRANPEGRVSCPLAWSEVEAVEPGELTLATVPARLAALGDLAAGIEKTAYGLEPLLELAARDEAEGLGDAPWPPHFPKQTGEPMRVQPSRARKKESP
ncbi:MAG: non-homologous end-joining DNA ligase [Myxococcaceae bacterium]